MEKVGLAICYVGIGAFYGAVAWAVVRFTKAALAEVEAEKAEVAEGSEPEAVSA
jgi:hypothetical protein